MGFLDVPNKPATLAALAGKVSKGELFINAKDYGATGNGATDDTAALQLALDAAIGRTLLIPAGEYKFTSAMRIGGNTTVIMHGATLKLYTSNTAGVLMLVNGLAGDTPTAYNGNGNITMLGGTWDAQGHVNATNSSNGFAFGHAFNITFDGVTIKNLSSGHAIEVNASKKVRVLNCNFLGWGGAALTSEAIQLDLATSGGFPAFGTYDNTPCNDVLVQGCHFGPSDVLPAWGVAVGGHSSAAGFPMDGVRIANNVMTVQSFGVIGYYWNNTTITGNVVNGGGIKVQSVSGPISNVVIANNTVRNSPDTSLSVQGGASSLISRAVITGNITEAGPAGIAAGFVSYAPGTLFANNQIAKSGYQGIRVVNSPNTVVSGNTVSESFDVSIAVDVSSTTTQVVGNKVIDAGRAGIFIGGASKSSAVLNNTITGFSTQANLDSAGIRLLSVDLASVQGNVIRAGLATNQGTYGIVVQSSVTNALVINNDLRSSGATGGLSNSGTGTITTSANA